MNNQERESSGLDLIYDGPMHREEGGWVCAEDGSQSRVIVGHVVCASNLSGKCLLLTDGQFNHVRDDVLYVYSNIF